MCRKTLLLLFSLLMAIALGACSSYLTSTPISKPDEHSQTFQAKEKYILRAIAAVLKEKQIGQNVVIDYAKNRIDSDYVVSDDWRTKTQARVKRTNWKECEVTLIVTTEKKTSEGWEMRKLLEKEQYESFFNVIEVKIYEEMAKENDEKNFLRGGAIWKQRKGYHPFWRSSKISH